MAALEKPSRFVVTGIVAVVNTTSGGPVYVDKGTVLPSNADPAHVAHLVSVGLVKPVE